MLTQAESPTYTINDELWLVFLNQQIIEELGPIVTATCAAKQSEFNTLSTHYDHFRFFHKAEH